MKNKIIIPLLILLVLLLGGMAYLVLTLNEEKKANAEMLELAELDKKEMENEYQQFAN